MENVLLKKIEALNPTGQTMLQDYLDFLLQKYTVKKKAKKRSVHLPVIKELPKGKKFDPIAFMEATKKLTVWTDEDVSMVDEARQHFNNWTSTEW